MDVALVGMITRALDKLKVPVAAEDGDTKEGGGVAEELSLKKPQPLSCVLSKARAMEVSDGGLSHNELRDLVALVQVKVNDRANIGLNKIEGLSLLQNNAKLQARQTLSSKLLASKFVELLLLRLS